MLFFTDLDNTVIYSHRHELPGDPVWVEMLNGRRQSFMTARTAAFYRTQDWLFPVPLTTRNSQQYARLAPALASLGWHDALVSNGAELLRDGVPDPEWREESRDLAERHRQEFEKALKLVCGMEPPEALVRNPFMFYVKTGRARELHAFLTRETDPAQVTELRDSRKVYCIPNTLNKGAAVRRYLVRFGHESCIAAGDSEFDIPMLLMADICLCPEELSGYLPAEKRIICSGVFSDAICDRLQELRRTKGSPGFLKGCSAGENGEETK